jgi:hypothetical protein
MTNNKQSMKLYTEEQVKEAIMMARITQGVLATTFFCDEHEVFEKLTPIELPSDEEIDKADNEKDRSKHYAFMRGAIWMRNKIQGGNK